MFGMRPSTRSAEVEAVDRFMSGEKYLYGQMPEFGPSNFNRKGKFEHQAIWPIADDLGVVTSGHLRVVTRPGFERTTIGVIYNNQCVSRVDFVPPTECESNPSWAEALQLESRVCGPHIHDWDINRAHVLTNELWELPCRSALPPQIRRFSQAFPWLAARVNLVLSHDQRAFDLPGSLV